MATDASILLGYKAPQITSPQEMYAQKAQFDQNELANRLGTMKMQEYESGIADKNALSGIYKNFGTDGAKNVDLLFKGGRGKEALELQKSQREAEKEASITGKNQMETAGKKLDLAGQAFGYVRSNPSVENAHAALDYLGQNGVYSPEQVTQYKQKVLSDPSQVGAMADMAFRAALGAKDQLFKIETRNIGGTTDTLSIDPVTGKTRVMNSVQNTQSPDSVASTATQRRGQDLLDARSKDANNIAKSLGVTEKELKIEEMQGKREDRLQSKNAARSSIDAQIGVIDKALKHPGREAATGLSGTIDPRNYVPGTDATDFRAVLDQIGGAAFLQAFESLKGGGQITEVEGKKATDAIARLNRAQSDKEFETSLNDLRSVMVLGKKRLGTGQTGGATGDFGGNAPATVMQVTNDADYAKVPKGAQYTTPDGQTRVKK